MSASPQDPRHAVLTDVVYNLLMKGNLEKRVSNKRHGSLFPVVITVKEILKCLF